MNALTKTSRWADADEDAKLASQRRQKQDDKRRRRTAEAGQSVEQPERPQPQPPPQPQQPMPPSDPGEAAGAPRPPKRRRLTPDAGVATPIELDHADEDDENTAEPALLQFVAETPRFGPCRSVSLYNKLNDIADGTYGWVSRARHTASGRVVALKRLKLESKDRSGLPVTGLREIQILRSCSHPNIVRLLEVVMGEGKMTDNPIFIVLEFVEHDIKTILEDMPEPFLASEVKLLLQQLVSGVGYLHDNWILHRDLKTSNLLLNNRGRLKIADFGMARYIGDAQAQLVQRQQLTRLVVTLWYRAPELLLGATVYDAAVDMWSVGCVFAELLTREPLLQGTHEVDQLLRTFELCGVPTEASWPGFRLLPNARALRLPKPPPGPPGAAVRTKFPRLTAAGCGLLTDLLSLDPRRRPTAHQLLDHAYFQQDPRPKHESMFPTFPSRAGQERRRRHEPEAPDRDGRVVPFHNVDFTAIFQRHEKEDRSAGFPLRVA